MGVYVMPRLKSKQARWGNTDGRTTWWVGYWQNEKTKQNSSSTPKLKDGIYVGNSTGRLGLQRGGSLGLSLFDGHGGRGGDASPPTIPILLIIKLTRPLGIGSIQS